MHHVLRAVVTGGAGFLGRHYVQALAARGYDVTAVDVRQGNDCRSWFTQNTDVYDVGIHCAGVVGGRQTIDGSPMELAVNLELDAAWFAWARRWVGRAVYLSSSAAYPTRYQQPPAARLALRLAEDFINLASPQQPDALYGWIKLTGERLAAIINESAPHTLVVRPFSGYGADQDASYPFRAFLERALRREDPFTIWGDGEQVRDFIHVSDVVEGTLQLLEAGLTGPVNLCTGTPTSFNQLAELFCSAAGYAPAVHHVAAAPQGVRYRVGDPKLFLQNYDRTPLTIAQAVQRALAA